MSKIAVNEITNEAGTGAPSFNNGINATSLNGGQFGGRRNLIINGAMQVSQRGDFSNATGISNNTYYLDRWKIASGVSSTVTHTGNRQRVDATGSGTGTLRIRQQLESQDITRIAGQQVTLSAKVKSNSANARLNIFADSWLSGSGNPTHSGNGNEETLTYTVTLPTGLISAFTADVGFDGPLSANVAISSGDYFEVTEVQLEVGDTATPFEHRSYGEELALCQRYYEIVQIRTGSQLGNGSIGIAQNFAVEKRSSPSITYGDSIDANNSVFFHRNSGGGGGGTVTMTGIGASVRQISGFRNSSNLWELRGFVRADAEL